MVDNIMMVEMTEEMMEKMMEDDNISLFEENILNTDFNLESEVEGPDILGDSCISQRMIHLAISYGSTRIFCALIDNHVDVNAADDEGATPLFYAVAHKRVDMLKKLLFLGANPNANGYLKYTPLFEAVWLRDTNSYDYQQECEKQIQITSALLEYNADATYVRDDDGQSVNLLNFMVCFRELDAPDPDEIDLIYNITHDDNSTYISLRLDQYIARIFSLLLKHGANPNLTSDIIPTVNLSIYPLKWVLLNGLTETARVLLNHGAGLDTHLIHHSMLKAHADRQPLYKELYNKVLFLSQHLNASAVSLGFLSRINERLEQLHNARSRQEKSFKDLSGINHLITPYLTLREHGFFAATSKKNGAEYFQQPSLSGDLYSSPCLK